MNKYLSVLTRFYSLRWAIMPEFYSNLEAILLERSAGDLPTAEEVERRIQAGRAAYRTTRASESANENGEIAVVQVIGPIIPRADFFTEVSGGATHQGIAQALRAAADDASADEIIVEMSTPGGTVEGVDISHEAMVYAASLKPVTVVSEGMLCSAGYWIAAPATKIVASPVSFVGSIGVLAGIRSMAEMEKGLGIKTAIRRSGPKKALGHPSEEISKEAIAEVDRDIANLFDIFLDDVAAGRGKKKEAVKREWGQGQAWLAAEALQLGLIDEVGTMASVLGKTPAASRTGRNRASKGRVAMDEELTQEEFEKQNPTLAAKIKGEAFAAGKAEGVTAGHAAGKTEGIEEGKRLAKAEGGADQSMKDAVVKLTSELQTERAEKQAERRTNIALTALQSSNLKTVGTVEGVDMDADFRAELIDASTAADSDDEAKTAVAGRIEKRRKLVGSAKAPTKVERENAQRLLVPHGDNNVEEQGNGNSAAATGTRDFYADIEQEMGLSF